MGSKQSSSLESIRPSDESTQFILVGARRVFASSTNTCYLSGRHLCFSHCSHPGCLDRELVEAVSEAFSGGNCGCLPPMASGEMALFLLQNISGRGADARRGFAMFLTTHIFLQQAFSSLMCFGYSLLGVTSFVSLYQILGCPLCSWDRVVSSGETIDIYVFSFIGM